MRQKRFILGIIALLVLVGSAYTLFALIQNDPENPGGQNTGGGNEDDSLTIAIFGDNEGTGPVLDAIIADVNGRNVDAVIQAGDATSHAEPEEFAAVKEAFARFDAPVYPVVGNNDIIGDKERTQWKETFEKERWYSIRIKNAHFLMLDNAERKVGFPEKELTWLEQELSGERALYTFLIYHRPFALPLENVFGDDETTVSRASNEAFRERITGKNITRIYSGHVHTYVPYMLGETPATVTGGGGAYPQDILGGPGTAFFHYILLTITDDSVQQQLIPIEVDVD